MHIDLSQVSEHLPDIIQGGGITTLIVYFGVKEFMNRSRIRNGNDDRIKWKDLFYGHEKRLIAIETKIDMILSKLIDGK